MNHVLYGAALPLLVCAALYARAGWRASRRLLVLGPLAMLISGGWATIPDLPRLWGDLPQYVAWHHLSYCNIFWGHCWFDAPGRAAIDEWAYYPVVAALLGALVFAAALRELRIVERRGL